MLLRGRSSFIRQNIQNWITYKLMNYILKQTSFVITTYVIKDISSKFKTCIISFKSKPLIESLAWWSMCRKLEPWHRLCRGFEPRSWYVNFNRLYQLVLKRLLPWFKSVLQCYWKCSTCTCLYLDILMRIKVTN